MTSGTIILLLVGAILILGLILTVIRKKTVEPEVSHDPRSNLQPNDTNYNMDMYDDEKLANLSPAEAREIIDKIEKGEEITSLSPRDFYRLKEVIDKGK